MTLLSRILPNPRLLECHHADVAGSPHEVWQRVRHGNLASSPWIRALFALRALPDWIDGSEKKPFSARIDDLVSTREEPGFQVLAEAEPPQPLEVVVGAIGQVWRPKIPFVHVESAEAFTAFAVPGFIKVAWAIRAVPRGTEATRLEIEVRVGSTDEASWEQFTRYFKLIGVGSRFIRRAILSALVDELGTPEERERDRSLPGDQLVPDARGQFTHGITIAAPPHKIWPWLLQMGSGRGGFYSIDLLDNGGKPSARELHPEMMHLEVGNRIAATPDAKVTFEVLRIDPERVLVLGGLFDTAADIQHPFHGPRPKHYWQVSWAFVLEPLDQKTTRLCVRARGAFSEDMGVRATWVQPVHALMERAQLRHLAERAEGRLPRDTLRDRLDGLQGAALAALGILTPFLRDRRSRWGLSPEVAQRPLLGDDLVPDPIWFYTHGIEIDAPAAEVWPWVAQLGARRAGFYSYQWLENLAGCQIKNAERVHPEWALKAGDPLFLHPEMRPLRVIDVDEGRHILAHASPDRLAVKAQEPWAAASWLFLLEPLGENRCRLISRFRLSCSEDLGSRLAFGPLITEPIGFAMDRRMLLGIKERAEEALFERRSH